MQKNSIKINKTMSEKNFEIVRKKRMMERIEKKLDSSHKDKIEKFNNTLSNIPEHFDIPRVGPG